MTSPRDPAAEPAPAGTPLGSATRVHMVGIGGAGMSALALILVERGHAVSGSDLRGGRALAALEAVGARVHVGHDARHVSGADLVVVSAAIPADNAETRAAQQAGIPIITRAELLERLMSGHRRLLVTGTHGKTTTTSMLTVALQSAGLDPSFAIGGTVHEAGTSAHHGTGELFVAEADEAYRSFLALTSDCAVVTNVEMDHHDEYASRQALQEAFAAFLQRSTGAGPAILCAEDPGALALAGTASGPVLTYGEREDCDLVVSDVQLDAERSSFRLTAGEGQDLGRFRLRVLGRHNVLNAVAATAAARWAGAPLEAIRSGLEAFAGAQRRFQRVGQARGVTVVDDYAHHPTEVTAVLQAARQTDPSRVIAVFQPHLYSRTAALGVDLGRALGRADVAIVTDVYGAREQPVPGVSGVMVADAAREAGAETHFVGPAGGIADLVAELARPGDLLLTLGAGDITEVGPVILRRLEGGRA